MFNLSNFLGSLHFETASFLVLYHLGAIHNQLVIPRKKNLKSLSVKRKAVPLQADYYQLVINF